MAITLADLNPFAQTGNPDAEAKLAERIAALQNQQADQLGHQQQLELAIANGEAGAEDQLAKLEQDLASTTDQLNRLNRAVAAAAKLRAEAAAQEAAVKASAASKAHEAALQVGRDALMRLDRTVRGHAQGGYGQALTDAFGQVTYVVGLIQKAVDDALGAPIASATDRAEIQKFRDNLPVMVAREYLRLFGPLVRKIPLTVGETEAPDHNIASASAEMTAAVKYLQPFIR